jgi:pyruvate kinase
MIIRKAKIVCTLGPASTDETVLVRMIQAGMNVARLNFSHGTHEQHALFMNTIRKLSKELEKPVTILQDLQGPKLRVGRLPQEGIRLQAGQQVVLTRVQMDEQASPLANGKIVIPMDVPDLENSLSPGNNILMDDGHLELEVTNIRGNAVEAQVVLGGLLTSNKGVNLPGARLNFPGFTEKDRQDLAFGLQQGVDALAISFVRTAADIETVRQAIQTLAPHRAATPIIAKLELPDAIQNLEEITRAADGVMVARGDLAVETSPATVPILQKRMIAAANRNDKIVITATQMLESMIQNPRPTRAEASDVANAVLDGTDAVMLSAESAVGNYPVESVAMMDSIVREAEQHFVEWGVVDPSPDEMTEVDAKTLARAARQLAHDRNVARIAVFTRSGRTARYMSKARPRVPIMAFTPEEETYHRMGMYWGVTPYLVPYASDVESMLERVEKALLTATELRSGEQVVLIASYPVGEGGPPNFALLHTVGERA